MEREQRILVQCRTCKHLLDQHNAFVCGRCHTVPYCCRDCQRSDWGKHKFTCVIPNSSSNSGVAAETAEMTRIFERLAAMITVAQPAVIDTILNVMKLKGLTTPENYMLVFDFDSKVEESRKFSNDHISTQSIEHALLNLEASVVRTPPLMAKRSWISQRVDFLDSAQHRIDPTHRLARTDDPENELILAAIFVDDTVAKAILKDIDLYDVCYQTFAKFRVLLIVQIGDRCQHGIFAFHE